MQEVNFNYLIPQFTINKYKIPFDIKQKSNNYFGVNFSNNLSEIDFNEESSKFISFSKSNFSFSPFLININSKINSLSSKEVSSFSKDIKNLTYVIKYKETSNICTVMRCLTFIEPLAEYFLSVIKTCKFFSNYVGLLDLTKKYFENIWSFEDNPFEPKEFIEVVKREAKINIDKEQDPFIFLEFIIKYINKDQM